MKKTNMFNKIVCFVIALMMLMPGLPGNFAFAAPGDEAEPIAYDPSDTTNFPEYPDSGYVKLDKKAEWVEGTDNIAKVTLSLEGKGVPSKTDVVLVIDKSGSMANAAKQYEEIPLTFTVNKTISYQYNNSSIGGTWRAATSNSATIKMTAYVDSNGVFKGYKSGTVAVQGLDVSGAARYRLNSSSDAFSTWASVGTNSCADALISIFSGAESIESYNGEQVAFPTVRNTLKNTTNPNTSNTKISLTKTAAKSFADELLKTQELRDLNRIGVVSYSTDATTDAGLTNDTSALNTAINGISATGGTNIQAGIKAAQDMLRSSNANNKFIVVLSDGQPTYSYTATSASSTDSGDLDYNYPSDLTFKLTQFNTTRKGTGNSYTGFSYTVNGFSVNNNGVPTISQALLAKKENMEIYAIGFDVAGNNDAEYTMKHIASSSSHYYSATSDLSSVYSDIAGKLAKAATNAVVNDIMGSVAAQYNFTVYEDDTYNAHATVGTVTVASDKASLTWDLGGNGDGGDITETTATLTYYVKLNVTPGVTIDPTEELKTNNSADVVYKNYLGKWCRRYFSVPTLTTGSGTIIVKYYLVNHLGQPINTSGGEVTYEYRTFVKDQITATVPINTTITVANYAVNDITGYALYSTSAKDENGDDVAPTLNAGRKTVYLNFPYQKAYTLTYDGNGATSGTMAPETHKAGTNVPVKDSSFTRKGYTFEGWNTKDDGSGATYYPGSDPFEMPANDATLYALWAIDAAEWNDVIYAPGTTDTVTNMPIGETGVLSGTEVTVSAAVPVRHGYTFTGWTTADATVTAGKFTMPSNDVTLTAEWTKDDSQTLSYTVEYYKDGIQFDTIAGTVPVHTPLVTAVDDKTPVGYMKDVAASTILPFTVTATDNVIKVYYVVDDGQKFVYTINYLKEGTNTPVAPSVTKSGIFGEVVTEKAIDIDGYNKVGQVGKTITLGSGYNVINFYYSQKEITKSDFYEVYWNYETGYNTGVYNEKYLEKDEGTLKATEYYVQLNYDSGYTHVRSELNTKTEEIVEVIDIEVTSGSAITGTAIRVIKTSILNLYYDRNRTSRPDPGPGPVTIPDTEIPLAELEKTDHFAYVIGYPEGDVRPLNNITREEIAMIFYRLLTDESRNQLLSDTNPFTDMEGHGWSNRAISTLYNAGIINGYPDGTFRPSDPISRAEFATIAAKFDKLELSNTSKFTDIFGHWAEKYITSSENKGWIKGYPDLTFKPEQDITRAEAMTLINNVLDRAVPEENIHPDAIFWPDNPSTAWYYEAVMEATNSHDYIYEEDEDELWTGMKPNKVWP